MDSDVAHHAHRRDHRVGSLSEVLSAEPESRAQGRGGDLGRGHDVARDVVQKQGGRDAHASEEVFHPSLAGEDGADAALAHGVHPELEDVPDVLFADLVVRPVPEEVDRRLRAEFTQSSRDLEVRLIAAGEHHVAYAAFGEHAGVVFDIGL